MPITRLVVGLRTESAPQSPSQTAIISETERYAPDFDAYLVSLLGFAMAAEAWNGGQAKPYGEQDTVALDCKQSSARWTWIPFPTMSKLTANLPAGPIHFERAILPPPIPAGPLALGSVGGLLHTMGQALGTNYYERHIGIIKANYGEQPSGWPNVWNFARVVRNAMAHGGRINFQNANAQAVTWKGLSYDPSNNGNHILHVDLWPGDLFDLLIEMDAEL